MVSLFCYLEFALKIILSFVVIISIICVSLFTQKSEQDEFCIEDWYAQTSSLFQSASSFFSHSGTASQETQELDAKLQELLPSANMDLTYHNEPHEITLGSLKSDQGLLPNLFNQPLDLKTQFKGQVHTDDKDNIVGAEFKVSIPADIR